MSFSVTKKAPVLVAPAEPTPSGHLPLSFFDRLPALNFFVETVFVFRHGVEPARVVREAVAKVLVPFYPVAGRITSDTDDGQLQVACTGEGLWFIEASAGCTLEDVGYVERQPLVIPKEHLIPSPPPEVDQTSLSFMVQVTEFTCGGFTIGFKSSHVMFGGLGAAQFKKAIGNMARGLARPTVTPVWCREAIPRPSEHRQKNQPTNDNNVPFLPLPGLQHLTTDLSSESIGRLKSRVEKETGQRCTVFDVVAAALWQCRTRAIGLSPEVVVTLHYPAMVIHELRCMELPPDAGYYGNCSYPVIIEAPSGRIALAPIWDIVGLIKSSKGNLSSRVSKWLKGDPDEDPDRLKFDYALTNLVDMRRSGLDEVDCGWGPPDHVVPLMDGPVNLCIALNSPAPPPDRGVRLVTHCVGKEHLEAFGHELKKLA